MEAKFLVAGDCAVSVQMGSEISLEVNRLVRNLYTNLTENPVDGITEMVPTYASLMVHYQPQVIGFDHLKEEIGKRMKEEGEAEQARQIVKEIPICYGGELGPDADKGDILLY